MVVMQPNPVTQLQNQSHGKLGHGGGAIGWNIGDRDTPSGTGIAIDHIVAGSLHTDQTDARTGSQQAFCDAHLIYQHDFTVADAFYCFRFGIGAVIDGQFTELAQTFIGQVAGV